MKKGQNEASPVMPQPAPKDHEKRKGKGKGKGGKGSNIHVCFVSTRVVVRRVRIVHTATAKDRKEIRSRGNSPAAKKGQPAPCWQWIRGSCANANCKFHHIRKQHPRLHPLKPKANQSLRSQRLRLRQH